MLWSEIDNKKLIQRIVSSDDSKHEYAYSKNRTIQFGKHLYKDACWVLLEYPMYADWVCKGDKNAPRNGASYRLDQAADDFIELIGVFNRKNFSEVCCSTNKCKRPVAKLAIYNEQDMRWFCRNCRPEALNMPNDSLHVICCFDDIAAYARRFYRKIEAIDADAVKLVRIIAEAKGLPRCKTLSDREIYEYFYGKDGAMEMLKLYSYNHDGYLE